MAVATEDMIAGMVKAIVDEVDPVRIILFGSQAQGNATTDSDVDLLVVDDEPIIILHSISFSSRIAISLCNTILNS